MAHRGTLGIECARIGANALILGLLLCLPAASSRAGDEPLIPVEAFYRHPAIDRAELSPSGARLAVTTAGGGSRISLVVYDLQNGGSSTLAARFGEADIRDFRWVNDDYLVFSLIDLTQGGGDPQIAPGLFSVRADGNGLRELINIRRDRIVGHRIGREPLDWNHRLLSVPAGGGNDVIVGRVALDADNQWTAVSPMRIDVTTQQTRSLAVDAPEHALTWIFDPRGEPRVVAATHEGEMRIYWRAPGRDAWTEIAKLDPLNMAFTPRFVDTTGKLYVTSGEGAASYAVLKRFDFTTGKPEPDALISVPGFDFRGEPIVPQDMPEATLGFRMMTDGQTTVWLDERMKKVQQDVDARLPGHINRLSCGKCGSDAVVVLIHSYSDQDPGQYFVYRPAKKDWQSVGRVRPDIDPKRMATLDLHRIRARDGLELPVWVTLPRGSDRKSARPAVVLVHGGPWVRGEWMHWSDDAQFLASRGYVVIEPEFRASTGYGYRHFRAGWKQWGRAMQDDVTDALNWAVGQGWVDAKRVCIAGASYGGYATLMGLVRTPELYRCGVAWAAVTDPRLLFDGFWRSEMSEEARMYSLPVLIGDPGKEAAALAAVSPVELASHIKAPLLLAFGALDRRVPLEHGTRLRNAMRAAGQEPEWVVYADEGHGWFREENRIDFARRMEAFLAKQLE
jgi:dipeptidyl aminopeptidase/acylaminoacyl peptidase